MVLVGVASCPTLPESVFKAMEPITVELRSAKAYLGVFAWGAETVPADAQR